MNVRPRRSVLYMPGSNARALEKAKGIACDGLILDLEDSVAPEAKMEARRQVAAAVRAGGYGRREVGVRINGMDTPWWLEDVDAAATAAPDVIVVPKVTSAADVERVSTAMRRAGLPESTQLWAMIETPLGVLKASEIAGAARTAGSRLAGLVVGLNDLVKETRAELDADRSQAQYWLSSILTAARAFGLEALDSAYNNFRDPDGLRHECRQARALGFDGKTLIHPDQVAIANEVFAPAPTEVEWSRKIIAAFERPENAGKGVINLDGRMVELLHRDAALRLVEIADRIAATG